MKILDCTLRDGGYYTNWDFDKKLVEAYCEAMEALPIEYVEIGYRSINLEGYLGEYFYCPEFVMRELKEMMPSKKLAIILNEKDISSSDVKELLRPCQKYITLVRIAVDPENIVRAIDLAAAVKVMGFEVAFNVMYMSSWSKGAVFFEYLGESANLLDYFYLVDSFGGVLQADVSRAVGFAKSKLDIKLGFHAHNNLEMALANTITAIDEGCTIVDATVTGMGRGAGNLRTELLLVYLNAKKSLSINFSKLSEAVSLFEDLKSDFRWGTNLAYIFSGAYSLPQKQVMEWVSLNRHPLASIVNALTNQRASVVDNLDLPVLPRRKINVDFLVVGGGASIAQNLNAIKIFLKQNPTVAVVHTGLKFVKDLSEVENIQYLAVVGTELNKLKELESEFSDNRKILIYPPKPRTMGTLIPENLLAFAFSLDKISFSASTKDSPLATALQLTIDLQASTVNLIGFDGYDISINQNQFKLVQENQTIFDDFTKFTPTRMFSLTKTRYINLNYRSLYCLIK